MHANVFGRWNLDNSNHNHNMIISWVSVWIFISCGLVSANGTISLMAALNHRHHPPLIHWHRCCQHLPKGSTHIPRWRQNQGDVFLKKRDPKVALFTLGCHTQCVGCHRRSSERICMKRRAAEKARRKNEVCFWVWRGNLLPPTSYEHWAATYWADEHWAAIWVISSQPPHGQLTPQLLPRYRSTYHRGIKANKIYSIFNASKFGTSFFMLNMFNCSISQQKYWKCFLDVKLEHFWINIYTNTAKIVKSFQFHFSLLDHFIFVSRPPM